MFSLNLLEEETSKYIRIQNALKHFPEQENTALLILFCQPELLTLLLGEPMSLSASKEPPKFPNISLYSVLVMCFNGFYSLKTVNLGRCANCLLDETASNPEHPTLQGKYVFTGY